MSCLFPLHRATAGQTERDTEREIGTRRRRRRRRMGEELLSS
jgi:hypothetical protein